MSKRLSRHRVISLDANKKKVTYLAIRKTASYLLWPQAMKATRGNHRSVRR